MPYFLDHFDYCVSKLTLASQIGISTSASDLVCTEINNYYSSNQKHG